MRRELDRWRACRRFVHQFGLMAKPTPKKRSTGRGGRDAWRPTPITPPKLGLAAIKHQQAQAQMAARAAQTAQPGRAFAALARVMAAAGGGAKLHPHRPTPVLGQCCEYCHTMFTWQQLKLHFEGGCPALKAG